MEGHSINGPDAPGGAAAAAAAAPVSSGSSFSFLNDDDFFDSAVEPEPVPPVQQQSHHSTSENEQPPQWQQQPVQHNSPQQWQQQQQQQQQQQYPSPQQSPGAESFVSRSPPPQSYSESRSAAPTSTASPHSHSHSHALSPAHVAPALAPHAGPLLEMPWPESPAASPGAAQRHSPDVPAAAAAAPLPTYSPFPVLDQQPGSGGTPGGAYPAVQQQQQQPSQQQQQQHQQHHSVPLDADGWQQWPAAIAAGPVSGSAPAPRPVSPVAPSVPFRSQPPPVSPTVAALPPHNPYAERPASAQQQSQQQRPQAYQQQPQQQQPQQHFLQSPASQSPMMQQQPLSHSPSQGAFPGPGHSRNQSGSVPPQPQLQQQSPSPNVPVGLPVQPGSAEIICPYCTVRLRFPIGAELVRCGSCNSISRLPPQMQTSPPQPQQVGQQQLAPQSAPMPLQPGMQPLPQPMMASQAPATRVRFQCSGCAQWLATDVGPDGSAVARCPSCQTLMRPMMTLAPPPPQQLTPAQLQAFQQQQRQSMPLQQQQQQQQQLQQQMQQQRPQQQLSGAQMQYPGNAHLLANPAMLPSHQQQQQPPQQLTVLQQQEYLLAQAAANKAARERQQQQGQAQPSSYAQGPPLPTQRVLSAGASFVGSAQTVADPRYQQQQQLQRPQSVRRPSGDYSGMGPANFAHSSSGPQQQRFAPAPRPSPSLQPPLSDDFVDAPYTPMNGAPSMAAGGGLGSQMAALHHAHNAAAPMPFSAQSQSQQSRPQWSEGKEESEAQVAADAEFARQMAERLNALDVSGRVDSEGAPIDRAGRSQAVRRVRATAGDDKALPLLANPL